MLQDDAHKTALGLQLWGWTRDAGSEQEGQGPCRCHQHCYVTRLPTSSPKEVRQIVSRCSLAHPPARFARYKDIRSETGACQVAPIPYSTGFLKKLIVPGPIINFPPLHYGSQSPCSISPPHVAILSQINPTILFLWDTFSYNLSFYYLVLQVISSFSIFLPESRIYYSSPPYVPHVPPISSTWIWYPNNHKAAHYTALSSILLLLPF